MHKSFHKTDFNIIKLYGCSTRYFVAFAIATKSYLGNFRVKGKRKLITKTTSISIKYGLDN